MLTQSGIHAVRALIVLASLEAGEYQGTAAIADITNAPRNYLGKLLQTMSRQGLVVSQKGLGGGFRLARKAEDISLYDIVISIEDVGRWTGCILGRGDCSDENPCPVHSQWGPVRNSYLQLLQGTRIADLVPTEGSIDS